VTQHRLTIPALITRVCRQFAAEPAIVDGGVTVSYAALGEQVERGVRALLAAGLACGDRVALWAPNIHEWIVAALSIHSAGGVLVTINTRYKGKEAAYILAKTRARWLFTVRDFLGSDYPSLLAGTQTELPHLEATIMLRGDAHGAELSWQDWMQRGQRVTAEAAQQRAAAVPDDALCDIMFTSGTTGQPKGVESTHGQTLRVFGQWCERVGLRAGDRYLVVVPFFHSFGYKAGFLAALMSGATVLPQAVFDAEQVLARIGPDRVTVLPGPPALYQTMLAHPACGEADLSSLRLAVTGAAVIPVELIARMHEELGFELVLTGYGLTESTGVVTMCQKGDDHQTIATTSGRPIDGVEVRLIDTLGREVAAGEPGEVLVRGYNVMRGYFEDPDATSEAIQDGWLHTGDIGVLNDRGYLRITDRKKDMYIVGGFNAYPAEIENTLLEHPAVAQVAVVGVPDARLGEVGVAFVVVDASSQLEPESLIGWSRERMANFKVPRRVELLDALPLNATGKVLKYQLRARALGA
jgi:acyl-CoA synthetase (AMP-forming)/AMP-acid ligase II